LDNFDVVVEGGNPGCGDIVKIYLKVDDNQIVKASFIGSGCTISQVSANLLIYHKLGEQFYLLRPNCASLAISVLKAAIKKYYRIKNV
jgi:nitrogen fixation NifU-like protein